MTLSMLLDTKTLLSQNGVRSQGCRLIPLPAPGAPHG